MSADWGVVLVDAILRERTLKPVLDAGINPSMLSSPAGPALKAIFDFYEAPDTRGLIPPRKFIEARIPVLHWPIYEEEAPDLDVLTQICLEQYLQRELTGIAAEIIDISDVNPRQSLAVGIAKLQELTVRLNAKGSDIDMSDSLPDLLEEHFNTIDSCEGLTGLPYPWEPLNEALMGMQKGELIVLYGLPKSMKTWVALYITLYAYAKTHARVLIVAPEMGKAKIALRTAAILAEEDYTEIKKGFPGHQTDPAKAKRRLRVLQVAKELQSTEDAQNKQQQRLILAKSNLGLKGDSVHELAQKIEAYNPALVYVDSAYMLSGDRDWKAFSKFLEAVKLLAEDKGITIILTSQENQKEAIKAAHAGKSPGASTASFAQSFIEFADLAIRIIKKTGHGKTLISLHLAASRETMLDGFTINANPGVDFSFHSNKLIQLEEALEVTGKSGNLASPPKTKPSTGISLVDKYNQWGAEEN